MIGAELNRSSAAHKGYLVAPNQLAHQANWIADILLGDAEEGGGFVKGDGGKVHSSPPDGGDGRGCQCRGLSQPISVPSAWNF